VIVGGGGKKGKSQGNEDSANANDMWVWMKSQIRFCTIEKCDLLSYFISIESLPTACRSHPLFFSLFETWSFSIEVSPLLLFNSCSFFRILLFAGERFHSFEFSRRNTC
jgi:hypothetical protein